VTLETRTRDILDLQVAPEGGGALVPVQPRVEGLTDKEAAALARAVEKQFQSSTKLARLLELSGGRTCKTCKWNPSSAPECTNKLGQTVSHDVISGWTDTQYSTVKKMRSEQGPCGPRGLLWEKGSWFERCAAELIMSSIICVVLCVIIWFTLHS
jgi:hypothetical protein